DGVAVLALRTGAPIVPLAIAGSNREWPQGQTLPHPGGHVPARGGGPAHPAPHAGGRVTARVGPPPPPADELPPGTDRRTAKPLVTRMIMERIAALLPASQRGVYGAHEGLVR